MHIHMQLIWAFPYIGNSLYVAHREPHTIVWCVSVPNGMEVDEVTDEVADGFLDV